MTTAFFKRFIFPVFFLMISVDLMAAVDILYQQPYGNHWKTILSAGEARVNMNEGKFPVHKRGKLRLELLPEVSEFSEETSYIWKLLSSTKEVIQETEGDKVIFLIPELEHFIIELFPTSEAYKSQQWEFQVIKKPWIRIVKPVHDQIIRYGQKVTLVANSQDYQGVLPQILWYSINGKSKRILGSGDELTSTWFDIGFNQVHAVAVDQQGQKSVSSPVGIIVPHQKIETRIVSPESDQTFKWNQPVLAYAQGIDLEYSLDGQPFKEGSSKIFTNLSTGNHQLVYKSGQIIKKVNFSVLEPEIKQVKLTRVSGLVESSTGMNRWKKVNTGEKIAYGYQLRTSSNGIAEILLPDGLVYVLNNNKSVKVLPGGKIAENLSNEGMMVSSITGEENIKQTIEQLKPMVSTLSEMLKSYDVKSIQTEDGKDLNKLIDQLLKGYVHIEDISLQ